MFKAARLLLTREPIISGNSSSILGFSRNASIFRNFTTSSGSPLSSGKAALMMHPSTPKFIKKESGVVFLNKSGSMMLRFVPAGGLQKYDWSKKQVFALSPTEVGCLISLGPGESCEFVHDPSMKSSLEGQVKKILSVKPISSEDAGYFINLTVNNAILKTSDRFSVPVSKAEFAVMRSAFSFVLPYIMGWDRVVARQSETSGLFSPSRNIMQLSPDAEWSR